MKELVLQERRTLDEVIKSSVKTFRNGCNYRLVKEIDDKYYLEYGCYGVLINLLNGDQKLLYNWYTITGDNLRKLSGIVHPDTISYLLTQKPCEVCGGAKFRKKPV